MKRKHLQSNKEKCAHPEQPRDEQHGRKNDEAQHRQHTRVQQNVHAGGMVGFEVCHVDRTHSVPFTTSAPP